ncbi:MAG TPA: glucose 1-dehydrogenase [Bryobacteraceae bacterium]|nr:glucose 1-dehydrogenase [Bryobacteraceae bacterium]
MKAAAVFPKTKSLGVVDDFPAPKIEDPTSLKLRILSVGVCGTDREIAAFDYGEPPAGYDYLVLGHETVGEVVEVGPEVRNLKPGDLAIPMVRRPCDHPECVACRAGRQDFCYTGDYKERGIKEMHGFMTELIVDEAIYMNPVPQTIRNVAVLVEPLTIAEKGLIQAWQIQDRLPWGRAAQKGGPTQTVHRAVVLGAGPVGLLGAMALQHAGFEVFVYSREREPSVSADIVKKIGGTYISSQEKSIAEMAAQVGNIDIVYEATGASQLAFEVLEALGTNGLFILTGVPGRHGPVGIDTAMIMRNMVLKNQCLLGTVNAGKDAFEHAIADLTSFYAKWPDAVNALITGRFPLDRFADPIHNQTGIKNIVQIAQ